MGVKTLKRARFTQAVVVIASVCVTIIFAEIVLRIVNSPRPTISGWKTLNSYKSQRHQLGFRGQPIEYRDDEFVIVMVGGETSGVRLVRLWRKIFPWSREKEWAGNILPAPYAPFAKYDGPASDEWQKRVGQLPGYLRYENFDTDKNDRALYLTPRSPGVQYGLDLTRQLIDEMRRLAASQGAQLAIFTAGPKPDATKVETAGSDEVVQALNGKFYKTSEARYYENLRYVAQGFTSYLIPVAVEPAVVGPEDVHLNEHANDQVMKDLAAQIQHLVPAGR